MPKSKSRTVFVCDACGNETSKWEGKCPSCGAWNTLAEMREAAINGGQKVWNKSSLEEAVALNKVTSDSSFRIGITSSEVNRVLGGGIVPGSMTLVAGDPGIGKSTLLLKLASEVAASGSPVLYVSGEESTTQVKMRADRLGISGDNLFLVPATDIEEILGHLDKLKPALAVVDSIQTAYDSSISSEPGGVTQIRECARRLLEWAKATDTPIFLTGHVTKGGDIAGPRVLEHMVDVVLYMEGESISSWRLLRGVKNRYGSTNEVGVFEMTGVGLNEVLDPSEALLAEREKGSVGSAIMPVMEGSRPLLVEIQALTNPSMLPTPRRVATGIDHNRLLLVCAVLSRRAGVGLSNQDVVVNLAGGLRINEPATDLGMALALASSFRNTPVDPGMAAVGEIGLGGEVRRVPQLERRIREAARLGFKRCLIPGNSGEVHLDDNSVELHPVRNIRDAINLSLSVTA